MADKQYALKEYLQSSLPVLCLNFCRCFNQSKKYRLFGKARERLKAELDVVALIRSLRFLKAAVASI